MFLWRHQLNTKWRQVLSQYYRPQSLNMDDYYYSTKYNGQSTGHHGDVMAMPLQYNVLLWTIAQA